MPYIHPLSTDATGEKESSIHGKDVSLSRAFPIENKNAQSDQRTNLGIGSPVSTGISISTQTELRTTTKDFTPSWMPTEQPTIAPTSLNMIEVDPQLLKGLSLHSKCSFVPSSSNLVIGNTLKLMQK